MDQVFRAIQIPNDEIQEKALQTLIDLGKANYYQIVEYVQDIGNITSSFINAQFKEN